MITRTHPNPLRGVIALSLLLAVGLSEARANDYEVDRTTPLSNELGLRLPKGFHATVFADDLGKARHLAVNDNGDVYVALREKAGGGGIVALRDINGDGVADATERFGDVEGTGIHSQQGRLYFAALTQVLRWTLDGNALVPEGKPDVVVRGLPNQSKHTARGLTFNGQEHL